MLRLGIGRLLTPTGHVFRDLEDDRLGFALAVTLTRPDLTEEDATGWLDPAARALAVAPADGFRAELSNTLRTLRVVYLLVDQRRLEVQQSGRRSRTATQYAPSCSRSSAPRPRTTSETTPPCEDVQHGRIRAGRADHPGGRSAAGCLRDGGLHRRRGRRAIWVPRPTMRWGGTRRPSRTGGPRRRPARHPDQTVPAPAPGAGIAAQQGISGHPERIACPGHLGVAKAIELRAAVDVRPYAEDDRRWWVVADLTPGLDGRREPMRSDYVLGIAPASLSLVKLTVPIKADAGPRPGHRLRHPGPAPGRPDEPPCRHRRESPGAAADPLDGGTQPDRPGRARRESLRASRARAVRPDRQQPAVRDRASG